MGWEATFVLALHRQEGSVGPAKVHRGEDEALSQSPPRSSDSKHPAVISLVLPDSQNERGKYSF